MLTGFVRNVHQLYVVRFLLGLAEAGSYPGIVLYLTYWFRQREQAQPSLWSWLVFLWPASLGVRFPGSFWIMCTG